MRSTWICWVCLRRQYLQVCAEKRFFFKKKEKVKMTCLIQKWWVLQIFIEWIMVVYWLKISFCRSTRVGSSPAFSGTGSSDQSSKFFWLMSYWPLHWSIGLRARMQVISSSSVIRSIIVLSDQTCWFSFYWLFPFP